MSTRVESVEGSLGEVSGAVLVEEDEHKAEEVEDDLVNVCAYGRGEHGMLVVDAVVASVAAETVLAVVVVVFDNAVGDDLIRYSPQPAAHVALQLLRRFVAVQPVGHYYPSDRQQFPG